MTHTLKNLVIATFLISLLAACSRVGEDEWAHMSYAYSDCSNNTSATAVNCSSDEDTLNSIGKGKR